MASLVWQRLTTLFGSALVAATLGCSAVTPNDPLEAAPAASLHRQREAGSLPLYGLDRGRRAGCEGHGFRGFDFWVGRWNVFTPGSPDPVGTNVVTRTALRPSRSP